MFDGIDERWHPIAGHAMHVGALASAATELPSATRNLVWSLVLGGLTNRALRLWTGFGRQRNGQHG